MKQLLPSLYLVCLLTLVASPGAAASAARTQCLDLAKAARAMATNAAVSDEKHERHRARIIDKRMLGRSSGLEQWKYIKNPQLLSIERRDDRSAALFLRQRMIPDDTGSQRVLAQASLEPAPTYSIRQSVYLEPGFDWGGDNEGGKLGFGLGGGSAPSGGQLQPDGFTSRFMWRGDGDGGAHLAVYAYAADRSQNLPYGDDHVLQDFQVPIGRWFELTMEVTVNSALDEADGSVRAWVDGELALHEQGMAWQTAGKPPAVEYLLYSTFYGGNDPSWSPDETTFIRFADVCWWSGR